MLVVAVHGGAGHHSRSQASEVKQAMERACSSAIQCMIFEATDCIGAVSLAISAMEDDGSLNAGYGSNLNIDGVVECDASIHAGVDGAFGGVAAVSGVKNPIKVAQKLLEQSRIPSPMGLVAPLMLASNGAFSFAQKNNIRTVAKEELVTPLATQAWKMWKSHVEHGQKVQIPKHGVNDTVGAVVLDNEGRLAAGVSSGGILLKQPGRIGEAAVYGAGCWARSPGPTCDGVAASVSGQGEDIIRVSLARTLCDRVLARPDQVDDIIQEMLEHHNGLDSPFEAGVLLLVKEPQDDGGYKPRLWCAFTTASMAISFATSYRPQPQCKILRKPPGQEQNRGVYLTCFSLVEP